MIRECVCEKCFEVKRAVSLCLLSRIGCDEPNPDYIAVIR
jgi:cysteine protease ATG4